MPTLNQSHEKVLRALKTNHLQNLDSLRKVAGKLISINFPKKSKNNNFCYLTQIWI